MEPPIQWLWRPRPWATASSRWRWGVRPGIWWMCWFFRRFTRPGKQSHNYGQSAFFMGNSTISTGPFSIAMLVYQRVSKLILVSSKGHTRLAWLMIDKRTMYTDVHMFYSKALWFHSIIVVWDVHYLSCSFLFTISCVLKCYIFFQIHATIAVYSLCLDHLGVNWLKAPNSCQVEQVQQRLNDYQERVKKLVDPQLEWVFCSCIYILLCLY